MTCTTGNTNIHVEDRASSDEDEYIGHSSVLSSFPGSNGTTQRTWRLQLEMLFPDVKADSIDAAIQKTDTLEEAANCIIDNSQMQGQYLARYSPLLQVTGSRWGRSQKTLEVRFENEDGLDGGAMSAEYFHLAMAAALSRQFKNIVTIFPNTLPEHIALDWFFEYIDEDVKDSEMIGGGRITAVMMFSTERISKSRRQDKQNISIK
eukprot:gene13724-15155_t